MSKKNEVIENNEHCEASTREIFKNLAFENFIKSLNDKVASLDDEAATPVLNRLLHYVNLIKEANDSSSEMMNLIVSNEIKTIEKMGYTYSLDSTGQINIVSQNDSRSSPSNNQLTISAYYKVLDIIHEDFEKNGLPENFKSAYTRMKDRLSALLNSEANFTLTMSVANQYLTVMENTFILTQYCSEIQILISIKSMLENFST